MPYTKFGIMGPCSDVKSNLMLLLTIVIVCSTTSISTTEISCPEKCSCYPSENQSYLLSAVCDGQTVFNVTTIYTQIQKLTANPNSTSVQEQLLFENANKVFPNLEILVLKNINLEKVDEKLVNGFENLKTVDLSENRIHNVDSRAFASNRKLMNVNFAYNDELVIEAPFLVSNSVSELNLTHCQLKSLPVDAFAQLSNLKMLFLSHNNITTIDHGVLPQGLLRLNLSFNHMVDVPMAQLESLKELKQLDLSNNPVKCTCALINFRNRMTTHDNFLTFTNDMVCASPPKYKNTETVHVNFMEICAEDIAFFEKDSSILKQDELIEMKQEQPFEDVMMADGSGDGETPPDVTLPPVKSVENEKITTEETTGSNKSQQETSKPDEPVKESASVSETSTTLSEDKSTTESTLLTASSSVQTSQSTESVSSAGTTLGSSYSEATTLQYNSSTALSSTTSVDSTSLVPSVTNIGTTIASTSQPDELLQNGSTASSTPLTTTVDSINDANHSSQSIVESVTDAEASSANSLRQMKSSNILSGLVNNVHDISKSTSLDAPVNNVSASTTVAPLQTQESTGQDDADSKTEITTKMPDTYSVDEHPSNITAENTTTTVAASSDSSTSSSSTPTQVTNNQSSPDMLQSDEKSYDGNTVQFWVTGIIAIGVIVGAFVLFTKCRNSRKGSMTVEDGSGDSSEMQTFIPKETTVVTIKPRVENGNGNEKEKLMDEDSLHKDRSSNTTSEHSDITIDCSQLPSGNDYEESTEKLGGSNIPNGDTEIKVVKVTSGSIPQSIPESAAILKG